MPDKQVWRGESSCRTIQRTLPSSVSTSFTLLGPMSHWHVNQVARAFILQASQGSGRARTICIDGTLSMLGVACQQAPLSTAVVGSTPQRHISPQHCPPSHPSTHISMMLPRAPCATPGNAPPRLTCSAGSHDGSSEERIATVATWTPLGVANLALSLRVSLMMPS